MDNNKNIPKRLSILMVCPQFYPLLGGYERAAERLSQKLVEYGHQVTVVTERRDNNWLKKEVLRGVLIHRLPIIYKMHFHQMTSLLSHVFFLIRYSSKFDVYHVHQYGTTGIIALLFAKITGKKVLIKITSSGNMGISATLSRGIFSKFFIFAHKKFDAYITPSKLMADEIFNFLKCDHKIHIIPNPIDINYFKPLPEDERQELRKKLNIAATCNIIFVGRIDKNKNPHGLLKAWEKVIINSLQYKLIIIGAGDLLADIKNKAQDNLFKNTIEVKGQIENPLPWYQAADIFVLTSFIEGLSNSLLEAISCGLPVVSTKISGSIDVFEKADVGELVETGNIDQLSQGLLNLILNEERRKICGKNARIVAEGSYSLEEVTRNIETLYYRLLEINS